MKNYKKNFALIILASFMTTIMVGCSNKGNTPNNSKTDEEESSAPAGSIGFGQWGEVYKNNSGKNYPCKVRITKVIKDNSDVQPLIDQYNAKADSNHQIKPLTGKDKDLTEYIVIEYEVLFPQDISTITYGNKGIVFPQIKFDGETNDGGEFIVSGTDYIDMGMNTELVEPADTELPFPGDTFKGKILFQMIKDYDNFYLDYMYKAGDSTEYTHTLFAIK